MPASAAESPTLTVAVVGAANFVAAAVLERLDADRQVEQLISLDCDEPQMPVAKLDFRPADVRDPLLGVALEGADVVVHVALTSGPLPAEDTMFAINVNGTRNLLDAAAHAGFVGSSTSRVRPCMGRMTRMRSRSTSQRRCGRTRSSAGRTTTSSPRSS